MMIKVEPSKPLCSCRCFGFFKSLRFKNWFLIIVLWFSGNLLLWYFNWSHETWSGIYFRGKIYLIIQNLNLNLKVSNWRTLGFESRSTTQNFLCSLQPIKVTWYYLWHFKSFSPKWTLNQYHLSWKALETRDGLFCFLRNFQEYSWFFSIFFWDIGWKSWPKSEYTAYLPLSFQNWGERFVVAHLGFWTLLESES